MLLELQARTADHYSIESELGRGGMGVVHKALDRDLHRHVAMKVMLRPLDASAEHQARRFIEEARATARLQHPGIVPLYDFGRTAENKLFFTMKLVQGRTLSEVIDARDQSLFHLLQIFVEVCNAVHYAHEQGYVHRDLKPANVMVGPYGEVQVLDWGIAALVANLSKERSGSPIGTPAYMAPEQGEGRHQDVGLLSDVYALGATLYHVITGRPSVAGETTQQAIHNAVHGRLVRPRAIDRSIPAEVEAICMKAMSWYPERRYGSAKLLAADVQAFLEGLPVAARPDGPIARSAKWFRRHRAISATIAASLVVGVVGLGLSLVKIRREHRDAELANSRVFHEMGRRSLVTKDILAAELLYAKALTLDDRRDSREGLLEARVRAALLKWTSELHTASAALAVSQDGSLAAAFADDGAVHVFDIGDPSRTPVERAALRGHEGEVLDIAFSPDRGVVATCGEDGTARIWRIDGPEPRSTAVLRGHTGKVRSVAFDAAAGTTLATAGEDGTVRTWSASTGAPVKVAKQHDGTVFGIAYSPAEQELASGSWDGKVHIWDDAALTVKRTIVRPGWAFDPAWSPDGSRIAVGDDQTLIGIHDARTGAEVLVLRGHERGPEFVSFAPGGRRLVSSATDRSVRVWDLIGGREVFALRAREQEGQGIGVAFHPDGRRLVLAGFDHKVQIWELDNSVEARTLRGHEKAAAGVRFSRDGKSVFSSAWDGTVRQWDVATGVEVGRFDGHEDRVEEIDVGARLVVSGGWDNTVRIWRIEDRRPVFVLEDAHESWIPAVALARDETFAASCSEDGTVKIWDTATGAERRVLRGHSGGVICVAISPDGRLVAGGGSDRTVRIWSVETGADHAVLRGHEQDIEGVAFSPDGKRIATGSWDTTVRLWDVAAGTEQQVLRGHDGWVYGLAFTADGRWLASASEDATVRLWDLAAGGASIRLGGHEGEVQTVAFSPDGRKLASASYDATVRIWDLDAIDALLRKPPQELVAESERRTGLSVQTLTKQ